ncbi:MAG: P-loop NTPase fold protein [Nocardiopsaceae bacterium]|nr:P-loop NTPase fold protein [Nocardiopsaceae bacterium]
MGDPEQWRFSLLNDEPVTNPAEDSLGGGRAARELADLIVASRGSTPFTLAVDSGWGTGKSSLMRLVEAELAETGDVYTVWYNAWTSTGADALEGIIKSVLMRLDRHVLRRALQRVSDRRSVLKAVRALSTLAAGALGVAGLVDELWKSLSASPQARNEMKDAIRDLTQEWAESDAFSPRRLLVVFIDDLDRCPEETVLAVCEAVKVYLDVPGLAFVIGCDRSALAPGGFLGDLSPAGMSFMEKIFQTNYRIPVPDEEEAAEFVRRHLHESGVHALVNDGLVSLIAERSNRNPRRIKRVINGIVLEGRLNPVWRGSDRETNDTMVRVLLLQYLYPGFYRTLVSGITQGDALGDFILYRKARRVLRGIEPYPHDDHEFHNFFAERDVTAPNPSNKEEWGAILTELESRLPSIFPALAADRGLVSLVKDLSDLSRQTKVAGLLMKRPFTGVSSVADEQSSHQPEQGWSFGDGYAPELGNPLAGKCLLWIDDNPASIDIEVEKFRRKGAFLVVVTSVQEAEDHLADRDWDLLISDITRYGDREAGFRDLERIREAGYKRVPVVFYTGDVDRFRERQAKDLGAIGITNSPGRLHRLVAEA